MSTFLSSLLQVPVSVAAFALWLVVVVAALSSTSLSQLRFRAASLLAGLYAATVFPGLYLWSGAYAALAALAVLGVLGPAKQWCIQQKDPFGLGAVLCDAASGLRKSMGPPLIHTWARCPWAHHLLNAISDNSWARKMGTNTWLFFIWFPLALRWALVVRITISVVLGIASLLGFLAAVEFKQDELTDVLTCWLALRRHMRLASPLVVGSTVVCWYFLSFAHVVVSSLAVAALAGIVSLVLRSDSSLVTEVQKKLGAILELCGSDNEQVMEWLEMRVGMLLWPLISAFNQMKHEVEKCDKQQLKSWFVAGFAFGGLLAFLSLIQWFSGSQNLATLVPSILVCYLGIASYREVVGNRGSLGRTGGFRLGTLCAQSAACLLTGRVAGLYMGFGLTPVMILVAILVKAIWLWLASALVIGLAVVYVGPLQFRSLLLHIWWVNNGGHEEQVLEVPYDVNVICPASLANMPDDHSSFRVKFTTACPFDLDQVDVGGLSKEWATLFTQAVTQGSEHLMWSFFRKWDADSKFFHLNYESRAVEQMKQTAAAAEGAPSEGFLMVEEEDIEKMFYKLGVVVAKCFLRSFQLIPLSAALIKFVLRGDDEKDSKHAITYADFEELCPGMAKNMRAAPEYSPFGEISLPGEVVGSVDVLTGFQDGDFNPEEQPTEEKWDSLAAKILGNEHVLPLLESFNRGFRAVIDVNLGELFSVAEVQQLLQGSVSISFDDLRIHACYVECSANHPVVQALWREMQELSQQQLQAFCQFVTGSKTPPLGGFSALIPRFVVNVTDKVTKINAHTCFNSVDLPASMDVSMMKVALLDICGEKLD